MPDAKGNIKTSIDLNTEKSNLDITSIYFKEKKVIIKIPRNGNPHLTYTLSFPYPKAIQLTLTVITHIK
jgi:hypothetical protein